LFICLNQPTRTLAFHLFSKVVILLQTVYKLFLLNPLMPCGKINQKLLDSILNIQNVSKTYQSAGRTLTVLDNINFSVESGSTMSIVGPSGSGKTTLLGLCAGLDRSTSGSIQLNNIKLDDLSEDERAQVRNEYVGFIFQNFQLMPTLTALENVMVPLELRGGKKIKPIAMDLLEKVGLADRGHHYPAQLSGGEQQRVSLARAFSNQPKILFADEPTGSLDAETSEKVIELMFGLNKEAGTTLILVTHDAELASKTQRIIRIKGGRIVEDTPAIQGGES
jgi:putative ABC transport system ATP-binding protein